MGKLIKQRHYGDCWVATFAMFLNCHYEESLKYFHTDEMKIVNGYYADPLIKEYKKVTGVELQKFEEDELYKVDWDRPAIISAPSLNLDHGNHVIYWDSQRIYDPSNKENIYHFVPYEINYVIQFPE